ncbi:MAG: serine hydrolase domain-containing protein, partial [Pseudomonadota bacterium]
MSDTRIRRIKNLSLCGLLLVSACSRPPAEPEPPVDRLVALDDAFAAALAPHDLRTVGAALIEDGAVVWTGYYGEQSPGVPASSTTQFNVASITKTVATEVVLRLVEQGVLSLDEPMATEWVDPDIADDPRHKLLTPRMVLTHTTGLPNWRFMAADRKLAFEADPGARFTYSGEGFEYLATFVEKRTGRPFPELVEALVFEPLGIRNAGYSIDESNFPNIAQAFDDDGEFAGFYCYPETNYCRKTGSSTPA